MCPRAKGSALGSPTRGLTWWRHISIPVELTQFAVQHDCRADLLRNRTTAHPAPETGYTRRHHPCRLFCSKGSCGCNGERQRERGEREGGRGGVKGDLARGRESKRERERETEREREREGGRKRGRETERDRQRDGERESHRLCRFNFSKVIWACVCLRERV